MQVLFFCNLFSVCEHVCCCRKRAVFKNSDGDGVEFAMLLHVTSHLIIHIQKEKKTKTKTTTL